MIKKTNDHGKRWSIIRELHHTVCNMVYLQPQSKDNIAYLVISQRPLKPDNRNVSLIHPLWGALSMTNLTYVINNCLQSFNLVALSMYLKGKFM